jgi:hypothetical protein
MKADVRIFRNTVSNKQQGAEKPLRRVRNRVSYSEPWRGMSKLPEVIDGEL